jgi:ribonuclease Z
MLEPQTKVTFLSTGSAVPEAGYDTVSFIINGKYLVDTGWYAAIKMLEYGFSPMGLEYLFITHCHHDHYIGLPHLLFYLSMRRRDYPDRLPLKIVGPAEDIERVVKSARFFLQTHRFPAIDYAPDIIPIQPGQSYQDQVFCIDTCTTIHPVQGLCYRFTDKYTQAVVSFTGDTAYHPSIADHVKGSHFLIHEASYGAENPKPGSSSGHSGAEQAASIAGDANVNLLALVHCQQNQAQSALTAAQKIFPNTIFPYDGQTVTITAENVILLESEN